MNLQEAFNKHNSDKGDQGKNAHKYYHEYQNTFTPDFDGNILEVGVFTGTSFCAFHEYMPNAQLYGIDIFTRLKMEQSGCYGLDRVHLMKADSTTPPYAFWPMLEEQWGQDIKFDVIIDDGKHTPSANHYTFKNLIPYLREGGVYYIEDVWPLDVMTEKELRHPWIKKHNKDYLLKDYDKFLNTISEYKYERIDLRKQSGRPDSYIFKIMK